MIEHNQDGAFGLIVNRLLDITVSDALPHLQGTRARENRLFLGGPVQKEFIMAMHDGKGISAGKEIIPGVFFEPAFENLFPYFQDEETSARILTFLGYSGWGPGQLETEMEQNTWIVLNGNKEIVFLEDPEKGWRDALRAKGGLYKVFADTTNNPDLN
jgi:putative transcriptional regulator